MKNREKIALALQEELEPLGYRYFKTTGKFTRKVDKDTVISIVYAPDCFHRGLVDVDLLARAEYKDIEGVLYKLTDENVSIRGHFAFICRLEWLIPESEYTYHDFCFYNYDTEDVFDKKLRKLIWYVKIYMLPYMESLSHKDSALEKAIALDRKFLINFEYVIPIMYCVWKHDKKAALDYLEEKRQRRLALVEPGEWERLERLKNGENLRPVDEPIQALMYEEYVKKSQKIKEWIWSQNYGE